MEKSLLGEDDSKEKNGPGKKDSGVTLNPIPMETEGSGVSSALDGNTVHENNGSGGSEVVKSAVEKTVQNAEQKRTEYRIAVNRMRNATKTVTRLRSIGVRTEQQESNLKNALEIMRDEALISIIEEKKPEFQRQHQQGNAAKASRVKTAEEKRVSYKRKVRSNDNENIEQGKEKLKSNPGGDKHGKTYIASKRNRQQEPKPGCSKDVKKDTQVFRVAVVNELCEEGKLSRDIWLEAELQLITHVALTPEAPIINIERSEWRRGRKIITCEDKNTANYLIDLFPKLDMKKVEPVQLKCVLETDLHLYFTPEARVWIPEPFIPKEILITAFSRFNPLLDVNNWRVIYEGPKANGGQTWNLKLNRECLPQLKESNYVVKFGVGKVTLRLPEEDTVQTEEDADCTNKPPTQ